MFFKGLHLVLLICISASQIPKLERAWQHGHGDLSYGSRVRGIGAVGMPPSYNKHYRQTGFELELIFYLYEAFLRLYHHLGPCSAIAF